MYADMRIFEKLDKEDQEKVSYFLKLLWNQSKYQKMKVEIMERRREIERGDTLSHEDIWSHMDV